MAVAHPEILWIVITSGIICSVMAMAIGANDVANAFSSSVGSGSLRLKGAMIIACVFEMLGALVLGGSVADSIRTKVLNFNAFKDAPGELAMGMMCASAGATIWLVISTCFGIPVSTTHSIIGALAGFGVASGRVDSIRWLKVLYIVLSWLGVPLVAVVVSCGMYILVQEAILKRKNSFTVLWYSMPFMLVITSLPLVIFLSFENPILKSYAAEGPLRTYQEWFNGSSANQFVVVITVLIIVVTGMSVFSYLCSSMRLKNGWTFVDQRNLVQNIGRRLSNSAKMSAGSNTSQLMELKVGTNNLEVTNISHSLAASPSGLEHLLQSAVEMESDMHHTDKGYKESENHQTEVVFSAMQIIGAVTVAISHSANDTANFVAPFTTVLLIYMRGMSEERLSTPWYVLLTGGIAMSLGLCLFGYNVIKTVGLNLTRVTPSRGYTIDSTAGSLVILLSHLGIPLSSTHCTVSSILGVGLVDNLKSQNYEEKVEVVELKAPSTQFWRKIPIFRRITTRYVNVKLYRKIFVTWITTMFFSAIMSAIIFVVVSFCRNVIYGGKPEATL